MRIAARLAALMAVLLLALPARAVPLPASGLVATNAGAAGFRLSPRGVNLDHPGFSLSHVAPRAEPGRAGPSRAAPPPERARWRPRWLGYAAANADELAPPAPPAPELLFTHAALGVAEIDAPSAPIRVSAIADAAQLPVGPPATLAEPAPSPLPAPLPLALVLALVLVPAGLVLVQALRGPPRRPVPAMRRPITRPHRRG